VQLLYKSIFNKYKGFICSIALLFTENIYNISHKSNHGRLQHSCFYFFLLLKMEITNNLLLEWRQRLGNRQYSENTITNYYTDANLFIKYLLLDWIKAESGEISLKNIEKRKTYLSGVKTPKTSIYYSVKPTISPSTIQTKITAIKSLLKYLNLMYDEGIDYKKIEQTRVKSPNVTVLTENEFKTLFDSINVFEKYKINAVRSQLLVNLGYTSGMRLSEMLSLRVEDIYDRKKMITWKGNKDRRVFFADSVLRLLDEYMIERRKPIPRTGITEIDSDFVFISHNSWYDFWKAITKETVCGIMKKYSDKLHLGKRITCHTLRHSYATRLLENWFNIREIQELLWHSDVKTTEHYCHVLHSNLEKKVKSLFQ